MVFTRSRRRCEGLGVLSLSHLPADLLAKIVSTYLGDDDRHAAILRHWRQIHVLCGPQAVSFVLRVITGGALTGGATLKDYTYGTTVELPPHTPSVYSPFSTRLKIGGQEGRRLDDSPPSVVRYVLKSMLVVVEDEDEGWGVHVARTLLECDRGPPAAEAEVESWQAVLLLHATSSSRVREVCTTEHVLDSAERPGMDVHDGLLHALRDHPIDAAQLLFLTESRRRTEVQGRISVDFWRGLWTNARMGTCGARHLVYWAPRGSRPASPAAPAASGPGPVVLAEAGGGHSPASGAPAAESDPAPASSTARPRASARSEYPEVAAYSRLPSANVSMDPHLSSVALRATDHEWTARKKYHKTCLQQLRVTMSHVNAAEAKLSAVTQTLDSTAATLESCLTLISAMRDSRAADSGVRTLYNEILAGHTENSGLLDSARSMITSQRASADKRRHLAADCAADQERLLRRLHVPEHDLQRLLTDSAALPPATEPEWSLAYYDSLNSVVGGSLESARGLHRVLKLYEVAEAAAEAARLKKIESDHAVAVYNQLEKEAADARRERDDGAPRAAPSPRASLRPATRPPDFFVP